MVLLMPSWGVGSSGAVGVKVAVQAGFGVMLGVGDVVAVAVGVEVGVWLGVGVLVAVAVAVWVAVLAMVGVGATVLRALVLSFSLMGVLAMATAVSSSPLSFNTAPAKKSSRTKIKNEPSNPLLRPFACCVPSLFSIEPEHSYAENGRQARLTHGSATPRFWFC